MSSLKALNGTITLDDENVVIAFKGMGASASQRAASPRSIPLGAIEAVDVAAGTFTKPGHLRLVVRGADGYAHDAAHDLNAVMVGNAKAAEAFASDVRAALADATTVLDFTSQVGTKPAPEYDPTPSQPAPSIALKVAKFAGITLRSDGTIELGNERHPVQGVTTSVDTAGQLRARTTATRVAAGALVAGPVGAVVGALFRKKVDDRQLFLTIESPDFAWVREVAPKEHKEALEFAAKVRAAGRS